MGRVAPNIYLCTKKFTYGIIVNIKEVFTMTSKHEAVHKARSAAPDSTGIPLAEAHLCVNCDTIHKTATCPVCASVHYIQLRRALGGPAVALVPGPKTIGSREPKLLNEEPKLLNEEPKLLNEEPKSINMEPKSINMEPKSINMEPKLLNDQTLEPKLLNDQTLEPKS